ncbi:MAG: c-type cytochrome [Chloroflexi bacterium]|nr:c-type cytochrome [Chloroflexota bacterium]
MSRKEEYEKEYSDSKVGGKSFFPNIIFKDTVAALLVLFAILGLAIFRGAPLEAQADPTNTAYAPRPEWYFLFLFEALKYFPGSLEWVAALGLPIAGIGVLVLLPFLDRSKLRHAFNRPIVTAIGVLSVLGMGYLTYASATAPTIVGAASADQGGKLLPIERAGKAVFQDRRCSVCHNVAGIGGKIGPDLTTVGRRLDATALIKHLKEPQRTGATAAMPDYQFTDPEVLELVSYLLTLKKAPPPMTLAQAGKATFNIFCNTCHPGANAGAGPKISGGEFHRKFATDDALAKLVRGGTTGGMPSFNDTALSDEQLSAIIAYLRTLK